MDDIKLYAKSTQQLQSMIDAVKEYSDKMKMKFGLEKCKIVNIAHGKLQSDSRDAYELLEGGSIEVLKHESDSYKYLGIIQLNDVKHEEMKKQMRKNNIKIEFEQY